MASYYWTDHYGKRWLVCPCLQKWLPAYEKELLRRGLIYTCIDLYQTIGNASASAGTHSKGGCADLGQVYTEQLRVARNMGAAAWRRDADPNDGQPDFRPTHTHISLKGCPHAVASARGQVTSCENGHNGLAGNGPDDGPRTNVQWPLRTWEQGIKWAADQSKTPGDVLNLTPWKLQVQGIDVKHPVLNDYSTSRFCVYTGGVAFRAWVGDKTTSGSHYPRSELRELREWSTTTGQHTLDGTCVVSELPKKRPIVVFAQIHDAEDDVLRLYAKRTTGENQTLVASWSKGKGQGSVDVVIGSALQHRRFTYRIKAEQGQVRVYINDVHKSSRTVKKSGNYFKAGSYVQSSREYDTADQFGEVVYYALKVSHQ